MDTDRKNWKVHLQRRVPGSVQDNEVSVEDFEAMLQGGGGDISRQRVCQEVEIKEGFYVVGTIPKGAIIRSAVLVICEAASGEETFSLGTEENPTLFGTTESGQQGARVGGWVPNQTPLEEDLNIGVTANNFNEDDETNGKVHVHINYEVLNDLRADVPEPEEEEPATP